MALDAAREIVEADGLRGLTTRRIAEAIGYSPGTLYQLFDDLDDLIIHLNSETLDALYQACRDVDLSAGPEAALEALADRYTRFVNLHPRLWGAIFEHQRPERPMPAWYDERINNLLGLADAALSPLVAQNGGAPVRHDARVLWAGLYGISSLARSGSLSKEETPERLLRSLIANYVAGLRARQERGAAAGGSHV